MGLRIDLHSKLKSISGVMEAYFQPPEGTKLIYPCIVYSKSPDYVKFADNIPYSNVDRYTVTVIDKNPESTISDELRHFPMCKEDRIFTSGNLNHFNFTLYY